MSDGVLTLAKMRDTIRGFEQQFGPPMPQMRLYQSAHWPVKQDGWETARLPAHPLIRWLANWLPITPHVEYQRPHMVECAPLMTKDGSVYMGPRTYAALQAATAAANPPTLTTPPPAAR